MNMYKKLKLWQKKKLKEDKLKAVCCNENIYDTTLCKISKKDFKNKDSKNIRLHIKSGFSPHKVFVTTTK